MVKFKINNSLFSIAERERERERERAKLRQKLVLCVSNWSIKSEKKIEYEKVIDLFVEYSCHCLVGLL